MGDPKKQRKKYRKPLMIWDEETIAEQKDLIKEFGLKNKKEIWKAESKLKSIHDQAKNLIASNTEQSQKEAQLLITKLSHLNLILPSFKLEDVLSLTLNNILNRRLQTLVFQKGLSKTVKQARQFITHNHIAIADQVINIPSYMVKTSEEPLIRFNPSSNLAQETHPERTSDKETQEREKKTKEEILGEKKEEKKAEQKEKKAETPEQEPKKEEQEKPAEGLTPKPKKLEQEKQLEEATPEERVTHKEK